MPMNAFRWTLLALPVFGLLAACSNDSPTSKGSKESGTIAESAPFDPSQVPETADAAVQTVIDGIAHGHAEALWHFLPASYQQDVNDVLHEFAQRMDPELWSKAIALLDKIARVLKAQRELFEETIRFPTRPGEVGRAVDYVGLAGLLKTLIQSDLGNLERLKTADSGTILAVTGGQFLEQLQVLSKFGGQDPSSLPMNDLSRLKIELKSSIDDEAIVVIRSPNEAPHESAFLRIEGKWIPRNLAENWIETIGQSKARLALLSRENLAEQKPRWMTLIATFDQAFDQLAAARNKDEFGGAIAALYLPGMMLMGMLQQPVDAGDTEQPAPENDVRVAVAEGLVTVIVRGKLDSSDRDVLLERLKSATGRKEGGVAEFTGDDESTSFKIGPVDDVAAFAKQVDFLKILEVDDKARRITAGPRD